MASRVAMRVLTSSSRKLLNLMSDVGMKYAEGMAP